MDSTDEFSLFTPEAARDGEENGTSRTLLLRTSNQRFPQRTSPPLARKVYEVLSEVAQEDNSQDGGLAEPETLLEGWTVHP